MNVKTFFIAAILSLTCFPLCAQAESTISSEEQPGYETGAMDTLEYGVTDNFIAEENRRRYEREQERQKQLRERFDDLEKQIDACMDDIIDLIDQHTEELNKKNPDSQKLERLDQRINSLKRQIRSLESRRDRIVF